MGKVKSKMFGKRYYKKQTAFFKKRLKSFDHWKKSMPSINWEQFCSFYEEKWGE